MCACNYEFVCKFHITELKLLASSLCLLKDHTEGKIMRQMQVVWSQSNIALVEMLYQDVCEIKPREYIVYMPQQLAGLDKHMDASSKHLSAFITSLSLSMPYRARHPVIASVQRAQAVVTVCITPKTCCVYFSSGGCFLVILSFYITAFCSLSIVYIHVKKHIIIPLDVV